MKEKLIFVALVAFLSISSAQELCEFNGRCLGHNLESSLANSTEECHDLCRGVNGCEWYTYDTATNFCVTFANCSQIDTNCTTCISGSVDCGSLTCFVPGECHGTIVTFLDASDQDECLSMCKTESMCHWFSYRSSDSLCLLLQDCQLNADSVEFVSGERECPLAAIDHTKIFYQHSLSSTWTHMPNTVNSTSSCSQPPAYPINVFGSTSAVVNGQIVVCGGVPYSSSCFTLNSALNIWEEFPQLSEPRGYSVSATVDHGWWITGGSSEKSYLSSTVLLNSSSNAWMPGPDLPSARHEHCLVVLSSRYSFISGGYNGAPLMDAWIYDWLEDELIQVSNMLNAKAEMACTLYTNALEEKLIMMAGGNTGTTLFSHVESFNLTSMSWTRLPDLPSTATGATLIQDGSDLFFVNPASNNIMQFDESTSTFTVMPGLTTGVTGNYATVLPIEDSVLHGC